MVEERERTCGWKRRNEETLCRMVLGKLETLETLLGPLACLRLLLLFRSLPLEKVEEIGRVDLHQRVLFDQPHIPSDHLFLLHVVHCCESPQLPLASQQERSLAPSMGLVFLAMRKKKEVEVEVGEEKKILEQCKVIWDSLEKEICWEGW